MIDWNTLRIRVEGAHVQTWLNGEPMADLTDKKIGATQGRIALQIILYISYCCIYFNTLL